MNKLGQITAIAMLLTGPIVGAAQSALKADPAYLRIDEAINLSIAKPEVNVNPPKFLLTNAASEFKGGPDDPFAKIGINVNDLIKDIKLIRVMVIEASKESEAHLNKGTAKLRSDLESNWTSIVSVPEDNVGIYAMSDKSGENMAGLALLINDGGDVIIGNVVGNLPIGKILKIAASMGGGNSVDFQQIIAQFAGAGAVFDDGNKTEKDK
ncbi:MAG: DUF4252 domain-containing protein [Verrucomicrobia bacterium]|nr:DUF4252 domain-containing protein [Verrucomicrobiota bacterium]